MVGFVDGYDKLGLVMAEEFEDGVVGGGKCAGRAGGDDAVK